MIFRWRLFRPVPCSNLHDKSVAVISAFQVQHVPVSDIEGDVFPGIHAQSPDAVHGIARAESRVRRLECFVPNEDHACVLHHWLNAALRKQDNTGSGAELVRHIEQGTIVQARVTCKPDPRIQGRGDDIAPLFADGHRKHVVVLPGLYSVIQQTLEIPPSRNNDIIADREAERSATPFGKQAELKAKRDFADSSMVVRGKREILNVAGSAGAGKGLKDRIREQHTGPRAWRIVLERQAQLTRVSDVSMSVRIESAINAKPIGDTVTDVHAEL